ncbi:hypothetical protein P22_0139 [Propionispora sp. 2/2-37]|uniref:hypothetical protein n=1 Tax=Propionispora sp. 2/2-37 TaxID=1677858 RepID=UPI0006BB78BA|nr:hypothetical protein [Propionispora sp. 2/2-37]CUH94077.1 hypothetical protein P22_0139 [Propionispora sp. 2/2-37]
MRNIHLRCIDLNTKYCPCLLAETNHCVFCSRLNGKYTCDCNWCGICVLYEKYWNKTIHTRQAVQRIEEEIEYSVLDIIAGNTFVIEFTVSNLLAEQLKKIGAFVFLRRPEDAVYCHFPVGIMDINDNKVQVAIEVVGSKSARLFSEGNRRVVVKGPYYNGIFGQPWVENLTGGKTLIVAGGIGQAPALPIIKQLVKNDNQVTAVLAPGRVKKIFIADSLQAIGVTVHSVSSMRRNGMDVLEALLPGNPDLVVSAGPDEQHQAVIAAMQTVNLNIPMAATNNATMCCGEGICGSCEREGHDGEKVKLCKVQTQIDDLVFE